MVRFTVPVRDESGVLLGLLVRLPSGEVDEEFVGVPFCRLNVAVKG